MGGSVAETVNPGGQALVNPRRPSGVGFYKTA